MPTLSIDPVDAEAQAAEPVDQQLRRALDSALSDLSDGVHVGGQDGSWHCNPAALQQLGVPSNEAIATTAAGRIAQFRLRRQRGGPLMVESELPFQRALAGQNALDELWITRPDSGRDVLLRTAAAPIRMAQAVIGAVAVTTDVTDRQQCPPAGRDLHRVEQVLHACTAELRALLDGVRDYAIFTLDPAGRITSWHQGAARMQGHPAEEAIGMPVEALYTPEDVAAGRPQEERRAAAERGEYASDCIRQRRDGSRFEAAMVLSALRGPRDELIGYLMLIQDITVRRQIEREREQSLAEAQAARLAAERASRIKGEFLATLSHELRTPLAAILGWAHVLERGNLDTSTLQHGLQAISRNARLQVRLIEDLLDMNRIESGQLRLDRQRIDLGSVVASAIDAALPAASNRQIGLKAAFSAGLVEVLGDAARLQQVVGNLLNNAIKFSAEGEEVQVSLKAEDGRAVITVRDTGQGIEPEFSARLFEPFQQQDPGTSRRYGGLGIGLSIVRHLVQLHEGSVWAHSAGSGQGATFTVVLPVLEPAADPSVATAPVPARAPASGGPLRASATGTVLAVSAPGPATTPAVPSGGTAAPSAEDARPLEGLSVLLVDDQADVRAVIGHVLQHAGARVLLASAAMDALARVRRDRPDLLVSDIGMPGMDGYEFIRRVRQLPDDEGGGTPAAAMTAFVRPDDADLAREAGYQLHLPKPITPPSLVDALQALAALLPERGAGGRGVPPSSNRPA